MYNQGIHSFTSIELFLFFYYYYFFFSGGNILRALDVILINLSVKGKYFLISSLIFGVGGFVVYFVCSCLCVLVLRKIFSDNSEISLTAKKK